MAFTVDKSKLPATDDSLNAAEAKIGIKLPRHYREFLKKHNGGHPVPDTFRTVNGLESSVAWFFAVHDGPYERLVDNFNIYKIRRRRIPDELIPVARDPGDNLICMATSGPNIGSIYYSDHEREAAIYGGEASYENCTLIASSLQEFIDGLYKYSKS